MTDASPEPSVSRDQGLRYAAEAVLAGESRHGFFRRLLPFLGPAFIASVAYIDPSNFATNISSGAKWSSQDLVDSLDRTSPSLEEASEAGQPRPPDLHVHQSTPPIV